jgi:hypothetical protein
VVGVKDFIAFKSFCMIKDNIVLTSGQDGDIIFT